MRVVKRLCSLFSLIIISFTSSSLPYVLRIHFINFNVCTVSVFIEVKHILKYFNTTFLLNISALNTSTISFNAISIISALLEERTTAYIASIALSFLASFAMKARE